MVESTQERILGRKWAGGILLSVWGAPNFLLLLYPALGRREANFKMDASAIKTPPRFANAPPSFPLKCEGIAIFLHSFWRERERGTGLGAFAERGALSLQNCQLYVRYGVFIFTKPPAPSLENIHAHSYRLLRL